MHGRQLHCLVVCLQICGVFSLLSTIAGAATPMCCLDTKAFVAEVGVALLFNRIVVNYVALNFNEPGICARLQWFMNLRSKDGDLLQLTLSDVAAAYARVLDFGNGSQVMRFYSRLPNRHLVYRVRASYRIHADGYLPLWSVELCLAF